MVGLGQRKGKVSTKDFFIFGSWYALEVPADAKIFVGSDFSVLVKTNKFLSLKIKTTMRGFVRIKPRKQHGIYQ